MCIKGGPPVQKRDILIAIVIILLLLVPFALREIYPNNPVIDLFFGGIRLAIYWAVLLYLTWRVGKWWDKKNAKEEHKGTGK